VSWKINLNLKTNSRKRSKSYRQNRINLEEKAVLLQNTQIYCSALGQSSSELNLRVEIPLQGIHKLFTPPHDQSNDGPPRVVHSLHSITSANEHSYQKTTTPCLDYEKKSLSELPYVMSFPFVFQVWIRVSHLMKKWITSII
jgi:hypothetical protein